MRKKNLLVLTVIALTVFLVACGSNEVPQMPMATVAPTQVIESTMAPTQTAAPTAEPTKAIENTEPTAMPTKAPEKELTNDPVPEVEEAYSLVFSRYTGVYSNGFGLAMAASDETAEIYYTLDGSNPLTSKTAMKYTGAIPVLKRTGDANVVSAIDPVLLSGSFNYVSKNVFKCEIEAPSDDAVDKCTVLRAVAKYANGIISDEVSATYFIGTMEEHIKGLAESCEAAGMPLSVISISANYDDLFGENGGIYMKGKIFEGALKQYLVQNGTPEDG
ncbi:MAG: chitobiase/beta-hexosaminidase C-terminal domain-containing protein, partial [Lachnospiraceae bacterium]|nr:chitobiase/beta-hexosaminidase C-terminal domain-containing protein [Lachnospiraceae bacterium]